MNKLTIISLQQLINLIVLIISGVSCSPMHDKFEDDFNRYYKRYHPRNGLTNYESQLRDLAIYKRKLQLAGYYPVVYQKAPGQLENFYYPRQDLPQMSDDNAPEAIKSSSTDEKEPMIEFFEPQQENSATFNDLEVLQLIPVILDQLKHGSVTEEEKDILKSIFGDLWSVIEDEANRPADDPVHPLLDILLQSNEIKQTKRDIISLQNDVDQNTIGLKESSKLSPSDQVLLRTYSIVSRSMLEKNEKLLEKAERMTRQKNFRKNRKLKSKRKPIFAPSPFDFTESTNEIPMPSNNNQRYKRISSNFPRRHKRSFHITKSDDLDKMKALVNYLNAHEDDNNDDDTENENSGENLNFGYNDGLNSVPKQPTFNHPSIYELFHLADQHKRRRHYKRF